MQNSTLNIAQVAKQDSLAIVAGKLVMLMVLGQFTFSKYPAPIMAFSILAIGGIFFLSLYRNDYFQFLMQLFICNHFMFGYENGGIYNMAASLALLTHLAFFKNYFSAPSSLGTFSISLLLALFVVQLISLLNNDTGFSSKLTAALIFGNILFLFMYTSKIQLDYLDFKQFIQITGVFFFYNFIVSINQKYQLFASPFDFFPSLDPDAEYEMGILRSNGVLNNFEFYAEYSVSLIALILPAILSGSASNYGMRFYYLCCSIIFIAIISIIFSGTRSSILLLPVLVFLTIIFISRRIKLKTLLYGVLLFISFFAINAVTKWIDFDVFTKRSKNVDMKNLTLSKILSGEEMNRGPIFAYGRNKIEKSNFLFGEGYFTKRDAYVKVHFDDKGSDAIPDYHNLYMSLIVIWGYLGAVFFILLFVSTIIKGFRLYFEIRQWNIVMVDLLLGFNLLFLFLLINQFKIQFIRDANYFLLILILLAVYNSLIKYLSGSITVYKDNNFEAAL